MSKVPMTVRGFELLQEELKKLKGTDRPNVVKAIAVLPGQPDSVHLTELEKPSVSQVEDGRGVLVEVIQVGVDGTDKEINAAEYGAAPPGYDFLVIGHESFGRVVEVGPNVTELAPGDYVYADNNGVIVSKTALL